MGSGVGSRESSLRALVRLSTTVWEVGSWQEMKDAEEEGDEDPEDSLDERDDINSWL